MSNQFARTKMLIGEAGLAVLQSSAVIVCGLGGVGSYVAESLARSGVGRLRLVDFDLVDVTNINRQLPALTSTVGQVKAEVMAARLLDINPELEVEPLPLKICPDSIEQVLQGRWDYVADAIDDVAAKVLLIKQSLARGIPVISSMGAGNKLNPTMARVADISETFGCALAKAVRRSLREVGINSGVLTVFSPEAPPATKARGRTPASMAFVPGTFGLTMAAEITKRLLAKAQAGDWQ